MRRMKFALPFLLMSLLSSTTATSETRQWSVEKANTWYQQYAWLVGSNFIPASAINQLEMWQSTTFDPQEIDTELAWAEAIGMNTMRVFLHDLLWEQDSAGFKQRISTFLSIADKHHIRPILVLFDSCWDPVPKLGAQHAPTPGVHNSGWVQSPGKAALERRRRYPRHLARANGPLWTASDSGAVTLGSET
jgi:hypothetical protein